MSHPVNGTQRRFAELRAKGGGRDGGPEKGRVLELLRDSGRALNEYGYAEAREQLEAHPAANPWHVCFALGLAWGHSARMETAFTTHAVNFLADHKEYDLQHAQSFYLERGPEPIEQSLLGAHQWLQTHKLPEALPTTLDGLANTQEQWLPRPGQTWPPYIGSWNGLAMFMTALFAQPALARTQRHSRPLLPIGGPVIAGLRILHRAYVLDEPTTGNERDGAGFESGVLLENNHRLAALLQDLPDGCLTDIHTGVYLLGTHDPRSDGWR
jgi:hypothetical protein